jgi:hypothetical protein
MVTDVMDAGDDSVGVGPAVFEMADVEIVTPYESVLIPRVNRRVERMVGYIQLLHIAVGRTIVQSLLPQEHILPSIPVHQYTAISCVHLTVQGDLQLLMIDMLLIYRYMRILVNLNIHPSLPTKYCSSASPLDSPEKQDMGDEKEDGGDVPCSNTR